MLTIIPIRRLDCLYCCVFPLMPNDAWSPAIRVEYSQGVLLEYDLEGALTGHRDWRDAHNQDWPADTEENARLAGVLVRTEARLPVVMRDVASVPRDNTIHYLSVAFSGPRRTISLEAWAEVREAIVSDYLPTSWPAPAGCDALLHMFEASHAVLLSRRSDLTRSWLTDIVERRLPWRGANPPRPAAEAVAAWVLANGNDIGVRISSAQLLLAASSREVLIEGAWGRAEDAAISAGQSGGAALAIRIPWHQHGPGSL